jgi:hypothetical protein
VEQRPEPEFTSHETVCIRNTSDQDAKVEITIYFADRDPFGPYRLKVPARCVGLTEERSRRAW